MTEQASMIDHQLGQGHGNGNNQRQYNNNENTMLNSETEKSYMMGSINGSNVKG